MNAGNKKDFGKSSENFGAQFSVSEDTGWLLPRRGSE
jgi:hypothetical protein